jgi:hypothetical protein
MRFRVLGALGALLIAFGLSPSAHAQQMGMPGQALFTYFETTESFTVCGTTTANPDGCNTGGNGDNIIRLVNPNGSGNTNLAGGKAQPVCAMIYVFDNDEEMGECCGCPLSSTQLATFSVEKNLTSNWGLANGTLGGDHSNGAIAIIAAAPNTTLLTPGGGGAAANGGCDPTSIPGYDVSTNNNVLGSITHNQILDPERDGQRGITEIPLSDDCNGQFANEVYLQIQCGALVGNGTGGGICNCPTEG